MSGRWPAERRHRGVSTVIAATRGLPEVTKKKSRQKVSKANDGDAIPEQVANRCGDS